MSKNIFVLLGNPRKSGNSDALAEASTKGTKAKGHQQSFTCSTLTFELMM